MQVVWASWRDKKIHIKCCVATQETKQNDYIFLCVYSEWAINPLYFCLCWWKYALIETWGFFSFLSLLFLYKQTEQQVAASSCVDWATFKNDSKSPITNKRKTKILTSLTLGGGVWFPGSALGWGGVGWGGMGWWRETDTYGRDIQLWGFSEQPSLHSQAH